MQYVGATWRKEINDSKFMYSVFVDLNRAFETINHVSLLRKTDRNPFHLFFQLMIFI